MADLAAIAATLPPLNLGASAAVTATNRLLAANLGQSGLGTLSGGLGNTSTVVELSRFGQLLSAATTFQSELGALRPGSTNSGGGQNFGSDEASLAAEVQSFVDSFNDFQRALSGRNDGLGGLGNVGSFGTSSPFGGFGTFASLGTSGGFGGQGDSLPGASGLAQTLAVRAPGEFANGDSELTRLADIGIVQETDSITGGITLSVDLDAVKTAFASDASGAFSLLAQAADEFGGLAGDFAAQPGVASFALNTLSQNLASNALLNSNLLFGRTTGSVGFADLLVLDALLQGDSSSFGLQQRVLASTQFALIGSLLG